MGKRNKGSKKQKKAHAKSLLSKHNTNVKDSSIFGVTVNKGTRSKGQRRSLENSHPDFYHSASSKPSSSNTNTNYSVEKKINNHDAAKKKKMNSWHKPSNLNKLRKDVKIQYHDQESNDFAKELASLNERKFHERLQKKSQSRSRRHRMIVKSKQSMNANSFVKFTPATFQIRPKTIDDLVDDAAIRVAQNLGVHDEEANQYQQSKTLIPSTSNRLQILAAQKRNEWKNNGHENGIDTGVSNIGSNVEDKQVNSNPFSVLNSDDEEDKKQIIERSAIQFAPATFQFTSSIDNSVNDWNDL